MSSHPERDQAVERLLQARRDAGVPEAVERTELCPSTDDIAAWADGDLEPARAATLEAHLASCARCEAVVAVFAKTTPLPTPAWTRWRMLVPFVAVAAAASVVLAVWSWKNSGSTPTPISTAAREEGTAPPQPATSQPPADVPVMRPAAQEPASTPAQHQNASAAPAPRQQAKPSGRGGSPVSPPAPQSFNFDSASSGTRASTKTAPAPSPPPPAPIFEARPTTPPPPPAPQAAAAAAVPPPVLPEAPRAQAAPRTSTGGDFTVDQMLKIPTARDPWQVVNMAPGIILSGTNVGGSASGQQLTMSAFVASGNVQWSMAGGIDDSTSIVSEFTGALRTSTGGAARGGGRGGGGGARSGGLSVLADSIAPTRWRIFSDGHVERSADDGRTWMRMTETFGVRITAGAAPASTVCWLAGRNGVVMLSSDADHFIRTDLPERLDAQSLTATSSLAATVVTTTGVTFVTTDGGHTWARRD